ncbi:MAG: M28 family peptidase, partial [Candidatus Poribacteria bacterium]|nr:M28 family peptidase [Candidatus Poribacteria bacterium]
EEFGILGSTEWVEDLKSTLQEKVIAYLNVDIAATGGRFYVSATPSLRELIREVTRHVVDPGTLKPVYESWKIAQDKEIPQVGNLGSGSDHSPFVGHAGIPALSMGFSGAYGVYHAMQDNFYWMEHFGDPTFQYQAAMSKIWGTLALQLANADILPFDYETYATDLMTPLKLLQNFGSENKIAKDVKVLDDLLTEWQQVAGLLNQGLVRYLASDDLSQISEINQRLYQLERRLTSESGLPLRPWFKHLIYAPGLNTGYAAVVFPGVLDAIEQGDDAAVHAEIDKLVAAFTRMIRGINEIREML